MSYSADVAQAEDVNVMDGGIEFLRPSHVESARASGDVGGDAKGKTMKKIGAVCAAAAVALVLIGAGCDEDALFRCDSPQDGSWVRYGHDGAATGCAKVESFKSRKDVAKLKTVWEVPGLPGATSTPVAAGGVLYFGDWGGALHAVDARTGATVWTTTVAPGAPIRSTPSVTSDTVYAAFATFVAAFDRATGAPRWVQEVETHYASYIESSPVVVDGRVIVGLASYELTLPLPDYTFRGSVVSLDATTGAEQWRVYTAQNDASSGAGSSVWSSASVDRRRKLVFMGTGNAYEAPAGPLSDSVLAINYETGKLAWSNQYTEDDVYTVPVLGPGFDYDVGSTPTLLRAAGRDLAVAGSKAGTLKAIDRDTGRDVWAVQLNKGSDVGGVMTSAATAMGIVFVNSNNWVDFGFLHGQPSARDTSTTFAVKAATGEVIWKRDMPAPMFGALTVVNGVLYQGLIDGSLIALDARNGNELWRDKLPGPIGSPVSVTADGLFVSYGFEFFKAEGAPPVPSGVRAYR